MLYFESKRTKDTVCIERITFGTLRIQTVLDSGFYRIHMPRDPSLHRHLNHELYFVESGSCTVRCVGREYTCRGGELLWISAGTEHCVKEMSKDASLFSLRCSFYPEKEGEDSLYGALSELLGAPLQLENGEALLRLVKQLQGEFCEQRRFGEEAFHGLLSVFYAELFRLLFGMSERKEHENGTQHAEHCFLHAKNFYKDTPNEFYMETLDEFFTHLPKENGTLDELSRRLYLSVSQTQRLIKRYYGISFREKLIQAKIYKSMRLMASTSKPLDEIAQEVGYDSYNAFFEAFCGLTGKTPSEYRKENKKG